MSPPPAQSDPLPSGEIDKILKSLILGHLKKLEAYVPGPLKKTGGSKAKLIQRYESDPLYSIFGLDSPEYVALTLGGGTITSIHRKLGDIYEGCVKEIFKASFGLNAEQVTYAAKIVSGTKEETRTADAYLQFDMLPEVARERVSRYCADEVRKLTAQPRIDLIGVGMEVRHCYQTGDSKRTQADEAMARHLMLSGVLPLMPLFCDQSNRTVIERYRGAWVIKQGMESYDTIKALSGYDFFGFLKRHRDEFRKPVLVMLRKLTDGSS